MKLKYPLLLIFFSCSFIFSQSSIHNSWITDLNENVNPKLTNQEIGFIKSAYGDATFKKIISIKALEKNIKDILRNRVQFLNKKFILGENIPKLSSISNGSTPIVFNQKRFNPLLYDIDFESSENQIYRVDGTDFIINIIPKKLR